MELKDIEYFIENHPELIKDIIKICSNNLQKYWDYAEKRNNSTLRTALSATLTILANKRRLPDNEVSKYLEFIKKEIFSDGINSCVCEGEKKFYKRYFECLDQ